MPHSQWICKICGEEFAIKGRRDSHRERIHRQDTIIGIEKRRVERSENGRFICKCGRDYKKAYALQRHQKSCKMIISNENIEEGI
jgi:hypothetical protein